MHFDHAKGKSMKKFLFVAILGVASNVANAQVNALPPTPHILVFGHAEARAIPDKFSIKMTVSVTDPSADLARRKAEKHVEQILAGLKQAGVPAEETSATTLKIEPDEEYNDKTEKQEYKGVQVSREIDATFYDLGKLQQFLGVLATSKELQVSGITTGLRDEAKLRELLRVKAIESTQEKAKSIAKAYAVKLDGLYSVSDVAPLVSYGIKAGSWPIYDYDSKSGDFFVRGYLDNTMGSGLNTIASPAKMLPPVHPSKPDTSPSRKTSTQCSCSATANSLRLNERQQLNFPSSSGKPCAACAGASLLPRRGIVS